MESQGTPRGFIHAPLFPLKIFGARWGYPLNIRFSAQAFLEVYGPRDRCWAHAQMLRLLVNLSLVPSSLPAELVFLACPVHPPPCQCQEGPAGAGREPGWGQQKVHKSLLAKTSALSCWGWRLLLTVRPGHKSYPTIDPSSCSRHQENCVGFIDFLTWGLGSGGS